METKQSRWRRAAQRWHAHTESHAAICVECGTAWAHSAGTESCCIPTVCDDCAEPRILTFEQIEKSPHYTSWDAIYGCQGVRPL